LEIFFFAGRKVVKYGDTLAAANELVHQVRADKSGAAGHKVTHESTFP
jgi:hypothetical protein